MAIIIIFIQYSAQVTETRYTFNFNSCYLKCDLLGFKLVLCFEIPFPSGGILLTDCRVLMPWRVGIIHEESSFVALRQLAFFLNHDAVVLDVSISTVLMDKLPF